MSDKKLSLHIGEKNRTTLSSGITDQSGSGPQLLVVGGPGFGGSGGSMETTRPPAHSLVSKDVKENNSITRDSSGHQISNKDEDIYYLA